MNYFSKPGRYLVISRPFDLAKKPTRSWAYVTVVLIWIYSAAFASMPLFGVGRYVPEGYLTSCSFDYLSEDWTTRVFVLSFFLGAWVVPLAIITVCYAAIVRAVIYVRHCVIVAGGPGAVRSGGSNLQSSSDHPNCAGTTSNVTNDPEHKGKQVLHSITYRIIGSKWALKKHKQGFINQMLR